MTFRTPEVMSVWRSFRDELLQYWHAVRSLEFPNASCNSKALAAKAKKHRACLADSCTDEVLDDQFVLEAAIGALSQYAAYWDTLMREKYGLSWSLLQDLQASLRLIKRFGRRPDIAVWSVLEHQCAGLEKLYPYRIFVSSEIIHGKLECSVCGKDMDNPACPHIPGNLYRGKLAAGIVREILRVPAIALVTNPMDKRCGFVLPDNSEHFPGIAYLRDELHNGKLDPLTLSGVEYEPVTIAATENNRGYVESMERSVDSVQPMDNSHSRGASESLRIEFSETPLLEVADLLLLRRDRMMGFHDALAHRAAD